MMLNIKKTLLIVISLSVLVTISTQVFANMFSFARKQAITLSHGVKGHIVKSGKPLKNITVYRSLTYGKEYVDEVKTHDDGSFSFPARVIQSSKPNKMFDNDSILQNISIKNGTDEISLWIVFVRPSLHQSEALARNLKQLSCDIDNEGQTYDVPFDENLNGTFAIFSPCPSIN